MKKITRIKTYLSEYLDIYISIFLLFLFDLILRKYCSLGIGKIPLVLNISYLLFLVVLLNLFSSTAIRKTLETVLMVIMTVYSFSQAIHYNFFQTFYSIKKLAVIKELFDVTNEAVSKIDLKSLIFFIPLMILIVFLIVDRKKQKHESNKLIKAIVCFLCALFIIITINLLNNHLMKENQNSDWFGDTYLRDTMYSRLKYVDRFGLYDYVVNDLISIFKNRNSNLNYEQKKEITDFINNNKIIENNLYTGKYEGKNLVLILCESLNNYPINEKAMPTLSKMIENGLYFTNFYAPVYQSATSDSEFISQTSMLPSVDYSQTCYEFAQNAYPYALANLFKNSKYNVNSYHANYSQFYNRELFHESLGFDKFYDIDKLSIEWPDYYQEYYNWIEDDVSFDAIIKNTDTSNDKPFYDFVITTSGHMPYAKKRNDTEENYIEIDKYDEFKNLNEEIKCYYAAQMNLDKGLEQLLNDLEINNCLENTIIILFGDHYPYGVEDKEAQQIIWGSTNTYEMYKTPLVIYDPSETNGKQIDSLCSTFDIYPTICNLFNLNSGNSYKVGKDIFGKDRHIVYFANRSVLTNEYYYDSNDNSITKLLDSYSDEVSKEDLIRMNAIFKYSQEILLNDFYNYE